MLRRLLLALAALAIATTSLVALPASAAPGGWSAFTPLAGSSGEFRTTMQQGPAGFPAAAVTSDSVDGAAVGVQSGSSTFLGPRTPVGAKYGSSHHQAYLNLRPTRLTDNPASTTTYVFEHPTPSSGWTFVLGDVDTDQITITATDARSAPVDPADLGFRDSFNYCTPGLTPTPTCGPPIDDGLALPTWVEADGVLRGDDGALDTAGAAAWFEPTVALSSLTFTYTQRSDAPVYQTWFSALQFDLSGRVTVEGGSPEGQTLRLYDPKGTLAATTTTGADGMYAFPGRATYDTYRVELVRPVGFISDAPLAQHVDLSTGHRTDVDFSLREIVPVPVSGSVTAEGAEGDRLSGVVLTLTGPGGPVESTTTDADGNYLFDDVAVGNGYEISVTTPHGFTSNVPQRTFNVPPASRNPIGGIDYVLTPVPTGSVAGTVTAGGDRPSGVVVNVTDDHELERVLRIGDDGSYSLTDLPRGEYTVTITAPAGSTIAGPSVLTTTITDAGEARTALDFELALGPVTSTYVASGTVTDTDKKPAADVEVTLLLPGDDSLSTTTEDDGVFSFAGLEDGDYAVVITPPEGYGVVKGPALTFDVKGEDVGDLKVVLEPQHGVSAAVTNVGGDSVPGAIVTLSDHKNELKMTTDESGTVAFTGVRAGEYTATITPPAGYGLGVDQAATQGIDVTDEDVQLAFVLEADVSPAPSGGLVGPSAPSTGGSGTTADLTATDTAEGAVPISNEGGSLPGTGGPSRVILFVGLGLLVLGGGMTLVGRLMARHRTGTHRG